MANIKDLMAAKQAAIAAAKDAGAIPGKAPESAPRDIPQAVLGAIETGMASSVSVSSSGPQVSSTLATGEMDEARAKGCHAVYRTLSLRKYVNDRGVMVPHLDGYFYIVDEADLPIMETFAERGKVEQVK